MNDAFNPCANVSMSYADVFGAGGRASDRTIAGSADSRPARRCHLQGAGGPGARAGGRAITRALCARGDGGTHCDTESARQHG